MRQNFAGFQISRAANGRFNPFKVDVGIFNGGFQSSHAPRDNFGADAIAFDNANFKIHEAKGLAHGAPFRNSVGIGQTTENELFNLAYVLPIAVIDAVTRVEN